MKTFEHNGRKFNVTKDSRGLVLVAPGRLTNPDDYQPVDVLSAGLQKAAIDRLVAKRPRV